MTYYQLLIKTDDEWVVIGTYELFCDALHERLKYGLSADIRYWDGTGWKFNIDEEVDE